ncbi:MAG: thiol:disulfide interchange protein DsbA/DsbL [Panacagrimonas sp.]
MKPMPRLFVLLVSVLAFACSEPSSAEFKAGTHYQQVKQPQAPSDPKRVSVEEFFWYGCGHCNDFDPFIEKWAHQRPADVDFARIPASLGRPQGVVHQKTFYTAEALNILDKMHPAIFRGIHDQKLPLFSKQALRNYFNGQVGILPELFDSTFDGFAVDSRVRRAESLARNYGVISVPTMVIGGRYLTDANKAGGFDELIRVIDFLVEKVRKEQK